MNDFNLPPRRELPDAVRDSIRVKLREGMDQPRQRSWRGPAVAAAAVAVLAAGALVATSELRTPDGAAPVALPPGMELDERLAAEALDRCWAAIEAAGKTGVFPARDTWKPVFTHAPFDGRASSGVTAMARAEGKPLVCHTTATTVTVSDPQAPLNYAPGTSTAAVLASPPGVFAGVSAAPPYLSSEFKPEKGASGMNGDAAWADGLFLWRNSPDQASATFNLDGAPLVAPPPAVQVVDRPVPGVDRTSEHGRWLGECLDGADLKIPDAAGYQPGALLVEGPTTAMAARFGDRVAFCAVSEKDGEPHYEAAEMPSTAGTGAVRSVAAFPNGINWSESSRQMLAGGLVPPETARMVVRRDRGGPAPVAVAGGGTFLALMPADLQDGLVSEEMTVSLYDARDNLILEQTVSLP
ncbi:hypothetical protein [Amycolatopsis sp. 195334CR]|uniref:hypothetical protein n=1 Tax=Amycolatopsis sp. 195334CR TaxID=2814588 RepID=UPI001A8F4875|nr:hypothetical protein [Amycolatopsis sp. 195334CR]MBN6039947.1 hypothetical protein [Amycolatopsis sp. 195334CR]